MGSHFAGFGFTYLCLAFAALHLSTFLDPQCGTGTGTTTSAEAPMLHSAAEVLPPLAALGLLFVGIALTYRHLTSRHQLGAAVHAGNGRRSVSGLVMFLLCVSVSTLELIVFGQAAGGGGGGAGHHGAQARAAGLVALRALPGAATVTFFCGTMLIVAGAAHVQAGGTRAVAGDGRLLTNVAAGAAHVRAGGEAGGTGAVAGDGRLLRLLTTVAAGAAAALVGLMVMALVLNGPEF